MRDFVFSLADEARRTSLVAALRQQQGALTLERLDELLCSRKYGDDLARLTIEELLEPSPRATTIDLGEPIEAAVLRVFRAQPETWLTSGFFTRHLDLRRWTAQSVSPNSPSTACWSAEARRQAHATASLRDHTLALDESS